MNGQQLYLQLMHVISDGARVDVLCSNGYRMPGVLAERFTYRDGTEGARVDCDDGVSIVVPLSELMPAGVTV